MHVKDPAEFKRQRKNKRYTQRELAMLVRRTQTTIWAIENGSLVNISEDLAIALAARLDTPWEKLFELREAEPMPSSPNGMHTSGHALAATA
ncbi:helix-turn-helix transcriptional regulator [Cellulosimicrobium sp. I38E]|uniref:helix-turn-helix transcriptional regulator n=1 Tax=Cellulosimicrobium sp. I38E TaxID=1393139 RepID=UPI0007B2D5AF|nr:helix-turn-helix transcriptional regulator [Cellulosimicrobium sp. I38E]KZM78370.1 transcriptional regulator [Cellulosimicrobium sp. I38E]